VDKVALHAYQVSDDDLAALEKLTLTPADVRPADLEPLRAAGVSDAGVEDAISGVCVVQYL
jgi:hypothetical protein